MERRTILSGVGVSIMTGLSGCAGFLPGQTKLENNTKTGTITPPPPEDDAEDETDDETDEVMAEFEGEGRTVTDSFHEEMKTILIFEIESNGLSEDFAVYLRPADSNDDTGDRLIVASAGSIDGSFTLTVDEESRAVVDAPESTNWSIQVRPLEVVTASE